MKEKRTQWPAAKSMDLPQWQSALLEDLKIRLEADHNREKVSIYVVTKNWFDGSYFFKKKNQAQGHVAVGSSSSAWYISNCFFHFNTPISCHSKLIGAWLIQLYKYLQINAVFIHASFSFWIQSSAQLLWVS